MEFIIVPIHVKSNNIVYSNYRDIPVTVAERSKACTIFYRLEAGIVCWNPAQGMNVWYVFICFYVLLCLGRGLATSWSPVQGVLSSVSWSWNRPGTNVSVEAVQNYRGIVFHRNLSDILPFKVINIIQRRNRCGNLRNKICYSYMLRSSDVAETWRTMELHFCYL
jgi:hypothetical protein